MKPGVTAQPEASTTRAPSRLVPIWVITPSAIATSAARPGAPLPSNTVPPRTTMSAGIRTLLSAVDHELQKVPVGIAHIHARRVRATTAFSRYRTLDDLGARRVQQGAERIGGSAPHEAEVAARRYRGGGAQGEPLLLPGFGSVKVDHLVARIDGHHVGMLGDLQSERAVERHHRLGLLHGQ